MIRLIAQREFTEFVRDGRLFWAGGIMLLLVVTALGVGWQRQSHVHAERHAAQHLDYEDWLQQDERHPHDAAHQGMHVFKPEPPLSIIDPGIGPYVGSTIWLQAHRQSEVKFRPAQDATGLQRFGTFSAAWLIQILAPLLIIVFGFNAFAGERELGTLRQLMSLGVSSRALLWGKALALAMGIGVLLVPGVVVAAAAVVIESEPARLLDSALRFLVLGLAYAVYLAIAIFVVLAVSARASSSRVALISLLALWIVGVLLAPRVMSDLSRHVYPSPSRTEFASDLSTDLKSEHDKAWREQFGVSTGWGPDLPLSKWGVALQVNDHVGYGVLDRHFGALWDTFEKQQRMQEWAGVLIPVLAVRSFSMGVAGTDFVQHRDFSVAAERQRRLVQDIMSQDLIDHADPLGDRHFAYQADKELWAKVPAFDYATPSLAFVLRHHWAGFAILSAVLAAAVVLALLFVPRRLPL
jgi:ABC-2 type transport system permease protein